MAELKWWEMGSNAPVDDTVPPEEVDNDPIRTAHMAHIGEGLDKYFAELKTSMMNLLKSRYNSRNGLEPIHKDSFMGLEIHHVGEFQHLMVDMLGKRALQTYQQFMHLIMIPQYHVGEELIEMATNRRYFVDAIPNHVAADAVIGYRYILRAKDTGLQETVGACIVESTAFVRVINLDSLPTPDTPSSYQTVQSIRLDECVTNTSGSVESIPLVYSYPNLMDG